LASLSKQVFSPQGLSKFWRGPGLFLISESIFALSFTLAKMATFHLTFETILWLRFAPCFLLIPLFFRKKTPFKITHYPLIITRCILGVASMACLLFAYKWGHFGKANLIFSLSSIWTFILSIIILKERPTWQAYLAIPLCLIGLFLIFNPASSTLELTDLIALIGSFGTAGVYFSLKELRKTHNAPTIIFCFYIVGFVIATFFLIPQFTWPSNTGLLLGSLTGVTGLIAQLLMTIGYKYTPLNISSFIKLTNIGVLILIGFFVFNDPISLFLGLGIILLFSAVILVTKYNNA